jgi:hypothetical protein
LIRREPISDFPISLTPSCFGEFARERTHAPLFCLNGVDDRKQRFLRLGAVPTEMGDELDRRGVQGPYSIGNASAQPDLRFAFP